MTKILIQRADRLGDMILALPVIEALKKYLPHAELHVLASPISKSLLEAHPHIAKVLVVDWNDKQRIGNKKALLNRMRYEKYDIYLSLWNHPQMALLGFQANIPKRIGDKTSLFFLTKKENQFLHDVTQHQVEQNLHIIKSLVPSLTPILTLYPDPNWKPHIRIPDIQKKLLIFHGSGGSNHALSEEAIIRLIDHLEGKQRVIVCYGKVDPTSKLAKLDRPHLTNITEDLPLLELQNWINYADYYVGSDTGPTHMASFLNKPMLVFSPKKSNMPSRWGPLSDYFVIVREDYQCHLPCLSKCVTPTECSKLEPSFLTHKYDELMQKVAIEPAMTWNKKRREHLRHTLRIAYMVRTQKEYEEVLPVIEKLKEKNIHMYPVYGARWKYWKDCVTRKNITIIQGDIPLWLRLAIRFYMATIRQYVAPVYVSLPLHKYVNSKEWIDIYHTAWKAYVGRK